MANLRRFHIVQPDGVVFGEGAEFTNGWVAVRLMEYPIINVYTSLATVMLFFGDEGRNQVTYLDQVSPSIAMEGVSISVGELARQTGKRLNEVIKTLWGLGQMGVTVKDNVSYDVAVKVGEKFGFAVERRST